MQTQTPMRPMRPFSHKLQRENQPMNKQLIEETINWIEEAQKLIVLFVEYINEKGLSSDFTIWRQAHYPTNCKGKQTP